MMERFNELEQIAWEAAAARPAVLRLLGDGELGRVELAEVDGALIGYAVITWGYDLEFGGRDAYLTEFYLHPAARGRGLGKELLAAAEEAARAGGAKALHLGVLPENAVALRLYRGAGYLPWTRLAFTKLL
jgi:ribosomal protein S18 acetylase RimI-like enzyme